MAKISTFPTFYNELRMITISFLKHDKYLEPNSWLGGTVMFSRNGNPTGSIYIRVNTISKPPYIELDYNCNQKPIKYRVQLVSKLSNLGKGLVWYFVCPQTGKLCRKLYLADTHFLHRTAVKGCMYEKQTQSKNIRYLYNSLGVYFQSDKLYEQLYKKHFKKQYAGKPTKRYLKLMKQIQKAENIPYNDILRLLSM